MGLARGESLMGITENLSPAGYLSTGVGPDVFALGEFEQLLRSIGYAVLDREHETDGRMVRLSVEKDGVRLGEISVRPDAGIYSSVPLDHSEIAQLAEWLRDRSNEEIWYWTSNGNECFRIRRPACEQARSGSGWWHRVSRRDTLGGGGRHVGRGSRGPLYDVGRAQRHRQPGYMKMAESNPDEMLKPLKSELALPIVVDSLSAGHWLSAAFKDRLEGASVVYSYISPKDLELRNPREGGVMSSADANEALARWLRSYSGCYLLIEDELARLGDSALDTVDDPRLSLDDRVAFFGALVDGEEAQAVDLLRRSTTGRPTNAFIVVADPYAFAEKPVKRSDADCLIASASAAVFALFDAESFLLCETGRTS